MNAVAASHVPSSEKNSTVYPNKSSKSVMPSPTSSEKLSEGPLQTSNVTKFVVPSPISSERSSESPMQTNNATSPSNITVEEILSIGNTEEIESEELISQSRLTELFVRSCS